MNHLESAIGVDLKTSTYSMDRGRGFQTRAKAWMAAWLIAVALLGITAFRNMTWQEGASGIRPENPASTVVENHVAGTRSRVQEYVQIMKTALDEQKYMIRARLANSEVVMR